MTSRRWPAWLLTLALLGFYGVLYFDRELFGRDVLSPLVQLVWSQADKWTLYGLLYTLAILVGGLWFIHKNRRSRYQVRRTQVIIGVQLVFAFLIPLWMRLFAGKAFYFSYLWPLKIEYFYPQTILGHGPALAAYSLVASLAAVPLLGYFLGKRWYCSWVCGCGGLANTFGDPWRHLSSKSRWSWRLERVTIHSVLVLALLTTALVVVNWATGPTALSPLAFRAQHYYGFAIGAVFSGMVGVAAYPLLGTRIWCRFGCPMAAALGLIQRKGRFRITTQQQLCIGCGNCSKYCEMGIDVRSYAMRGEPVRRASCVGCGLCAHVCPRGVLRLENSRS